MFKLVYLRNYKLDTNFRDCLFFLFNYIYSVYYSAFQHFIFFFYILFWFIKSFEYNIFLLILFKKIS